MQCVSTIGSWSRVVDDKENKATCVHFSGKLVNTRLLRGLRNMDSKAVGGALMVRNASMRVRRQSVLICLFDSLVEVEATPSTAVVGQLSGSYQVFGTASFDPVMLFNTARMYEF